MMKAIYRKISIALKIVITLLLLFYLFRNIDVNILRNNLLKFSVNSLIFVLTCLTLQIFLSTYRLKLILNTLNIEFGYGELLRINYIGHFFSQTLPATVGGDAVRVWHIKNNNIGWLDSVCGVFYDRYIGLVSLFFIMAAFLLSLAKIVNDQLLFNSIVFLTLMGLGSILVIIWIDKFAIYFDTNNSLFHKINRIIAHGTSILINNLVLFKTLAVSVIIHMTGILAVYILSQDLGLNVSYVHFLIFMPFVFLFSSIPISIAGWGTRESAMVYSLGYMNIDSAESLVLSMIFGMLIMISGLPGCVLMNLAKKKY